MSNIGLKRLWMLCRMSRGDGLYIPVGSIRMFSKKDFGYIYRENDTCYIIIDGSSNLREWLENFAWFRVGRFSVSIGFRNRAMDFLDSVMINVKYSENIVVTGHSRGGAIAQSLALLMEHRGYTISGIYTFGSPKVGGRKFCNELKRCCIKHHRIAAKGDIVTMLPFLRGRHYQTKLIKLENNYKKIINKHLRYGNMINGHNNNT